jgi:hypothetical protein
VARGSGSSGGSYSYRQWAVAERAAEREREQRRKQAEKDRVAAEVAARDDEAAARTLDVEQRVAELESLLRSSLGRDPRIRFDSLRISASVPPLDLGPLTSPVPAPQWAEFEPERPTALGRMFGGASAIRLPTKWYLPTFDVIPAHKAFRHVKASQSVEPVARPPAEAQRLYSAVIAQVAVRTVREVFTATPPDMVSTVVFNGHVDTVDPATGQKIRPPLISMRATRERFDELVLTEPRFDPVASIKRHFFAAISLHPEELKPVEPVMPFSRADPRIVEAIDVISTLDQRPNLLDLSPEAFESFVQNLFTKMGYETDRYRSSNDGGIDCMAYKRDPVAPMKIAVQAKLYTRTVSPTHVRDLYGTMQHEGATLGIMITTSGYGPSSEEFANGKPLHRPAA